MAKITQYQLLKTLDKINPKLKTKIVNNLIKAWDKK